MQRALFKAIQDVVRKPAGKFRLTKALRAIYDEYSIGVLSGAAYIVFSRDDLERLRSVVEASHVADPMHESVEVPRTKLAKVSNDEKLTNVSVFGDLLQLVKVSSGPIKTKFGIGVAPPYTLLSVPYKDITLEGEKLIVIENGDTIRNWSEIRLPSILDAATLIYRGHGESARYVRDIIRLHSKCNLYAYFDFDPSGLCKALTLGITRFVIPSNWKSLHLSPIYRFNKSTVFWKQQKDLDFLLSCESSLVQEIAVYMKAHNIALTQEHFTAHRVELTVV